jgi:tetratricopeptide (TPR) repeat protein
MQNKNIKFQKIIRTAIYAMAFLVPIFFLPITSEAFEFNKMYLITLITSFCLLVWGIQVITQKEIKVAKTKVLLPGLLLISSVFLSTVFSIDKTSSIFGASGRWYPSLVSFITLGVLYIIITTHITEKKDIKAILISLASGTTVSSIIASLSFVGILFIKGTDQNFNPTGSLLTLGVLAVLASIVCAYTLIKESNITFKIISLAALIPNFFYLTVYDNVKTWVLLGIGILLLSTVLKVEEIKANKLFALISGIIVVAILSLSIVPVTRAIVMKHEYPVELHVPFRESWNIAISTMRDFPIVGTGPSTFYLNYPRYRSASMNQTDSWNIRFDKPQNEALLIISSLGILGILSSAYFAVEVVKNILKTLKKDNLSRFIAILTILILVTMSITYITVPLGFTFILLLGILAGLDNDKFLFFAANRKATGGDVFSLEGHPSNENEGFLTAIIALPLLVLAGLGLVTIYKVYPSEYYMQKAMQVLNTDASKSYEYQTKAIKLNPKRSSYYNTFAQTNLAIAINLSNQEGLDETNAETVQNLIATAISASKIATESVSPINPVNWEIQAGIYRAIREAAQDADQWAIRALEAAIQLDPTNPQLRLELGGIYYSAKDYATAATFFRQATNLKTDYANAYYNFAQAAKGLNDLATAKRALDLTLALVEANSEDAELVRKEIADMEKEIALLEDKTQKPTVEELANQAEVVERGESGEITEQEPLVVEGERKEFVEPIKETINPEEESVEKDLE